MIQNTWGSKISYKPWGKHNGQEVYLFKLENANGSFVELTNYGASIVSVVVPDKGNRLGNVVLGFPSLEGYLKDSCYMGATIGRFANRIGNAKFMLEEETYYLEKNDNNNTNHGGNSGFNSKVFDFSIHNGRLSFTLKSKDGEGGYPGNLDFKSDYIWSEEDALSIEYAAVSDKKTIANFTNHAYFNLSACTAKIFDHILTINASEIVETNQDYIPTGHIVPVADKSFYQNKVRNRITKKGDDIKGLNSYYIFNEVENKFDKAAGLLFDPLSGRQMEVFTTYPGMQLYTGDFITSPSLSAHSSHYKPFDGLCLECQHFPDAPNHAGFPSTVIAAGQTYKERITFKFSIRT